MRGCSCRRPGDTVQELEMTVQRPPTLTPGVPDNQHTHTPVSYTHLTLPTIYSV